MVSQKKKITSPIGPRSPTQYLARNPSFYHVLKFFEVWAKLELVSKVFKPKKKKKNKNTNKSPSLSEQ